MGEHATKTLVTYECGHKRQFAAPVPMKGEILWCLSCQKEKKVLFSLDEYKIRCRGCTYSRPFGAARLGAEIAAAKHRQRFPDHDVELLCGREVTKTFTDLRNQTVIPMTSDSDQIPAF